MRSRILPPPVSLVSAGMSGFWGSEPFVVMIASEAPSPVVAESAVPPEQADRPRAKTAGTASQVLLRFMKTPLIRWVDPASFRHKCSSSLSGPESDLPLQTP